MLCCALSPRGPSLPLQGSSETWQFLWWRTQRICNNSLSLARLPEDSSPLRFRARNGGLAWRLLWDDRCFRGTSERPRRSRKAHGCKERCLIAAPLEASLNQGLLRCQAPRRRSSIVLAATARRYEGSKAAISEREKAPGGGVQESNPRAADGLTESTLPDNVKSR